MAHEFNHDIAVLYARALGSISFSEIFAPNSENFHLDY